MSEIFINKLKTCAVSGHRKIEKIDLLKLEEVFFNVIREIITNIFITILKRIKFDINILNIMNNFLGYQFI